MASRDEFALPRAPAAPQDSTVATGPPAGSGRSVAAGRLRVAVGLLIGAGAIYAVVSSAGGFSAAPEFASDWSWPDWGTSSRRRPPRV